MGNSEPHGQETGEVPSWLLQYKMPIEWISRERAAYQANPDKYHQDTKNFGDYLFRRDSLPGQWTHDLARRDYVCKLEIEMEAYGDETVELKEASEKEEAIIEKVKIISEKWFSIKKTHPPEVYRSLKERLRQCSTGEADFVSKDLKISKEQAGKILTGLELLERKNPTKLKVKWEQFKNPSTVQDVRQLTDWELEQLYELTRFCRDDVSFFSIPCTKPLGVSPHVLGYSGSIGHEHDAYHVYNDNSEDLTELQKNITAQIPTLLRDQMGRADGAKCKLVQFWDHPKDRTKTIMLVDTIFPGGGANKHDPRNGSSQYVVVLSKGNKMVQLLREGKCTRLIDHVIRNLAVDLDPWALPLVDSKLSVDGLDISIQDFAKRNIVNVSGQGQSVSRYDDLTQPDFARIAAESGAHKKDKYGHGGGYLDVLPQTQTFREKYGSRTTLAQMGFDER